MAITNSDSQETVADGFLHLAAETIRDANSSDAALRMAIGRAYYSVFLTVRDKLFGPDGTQLKRKLNDFLKDRCSRQRHAESVGSHDVVIYAITDLPSSKDILRPLTLRDQIYQLKDARICADYYFTPASLSAIPADNWRQYANDTIALASQILPKVRRLTRVYVDAPAVLRRPASILDVLVSCGDKICPVLLDR